MPITSSHLRGREEACLGEVWEEDADLDHPGWRQRLASSETIAYACQDPPPALTPKSGYTNIPELWTGRLAWPGLGWGRDLKAEGREPSLSAAFPSPQEANSPAPTQGQDHILRTPANMILAEAGWRGAETQPLRTSEHI